jgi:asparagine synthase (glutamine-hydrolysing)
VKAVNGICGVWRFEDGARGAVALKRMLGSQSGAEVHARDAGVSLGVVPRFAAQSVFANTRVAVVCDAELCNGRELAAIVGLPGEASSAQLLAALWERFGEESLPKLRGAFSLILFDVNARRLTAAVDRFGIQTLVYATRPGIAAIASRIDALHATGEITSTTDPHAIARYLNYTVNLGPNTVFSGVKRLLPGTVLTVTANVDAQVRTWWDMQYTAETRADEDALAAEMREVVAESVGAHCFGHDRLDHLGAFLSGGTDSSTVAAMMHRLGRGTVNTFSIGFAEERFNELDYARITARHFGAKHHEYLVTAADCMNAIPAILAEFDEPFGNSSAIPTYFCAKLARENGVSELLAGDGGDELFGGNERYATDRIFSIYHDIPAFVRKGLIEPALGVIPFARARRYVSRANLPGPQRFFTFNLLVDNPLQRIFEDDFVESLAGSDVLQVPSRYYSQARAHSHLDRLLYVDVKITLADNDLIKVTRMSELAGIRARFPLLDAAVAEFSGRVPAHLKVKGFDKRYLFKKAFRPVLAPETIAKKKHGFGIPVAFWMKSDPQMRDMMYDVMLSPRTYSRGIVRRDYIEELLRLHKSDETAFFGDTLWTFLALELWFRRAVDGTQQAAA